MDENTQSTRARQPDQSARDQSVSPVSLRDSGMPEVPEGVCLAAGRILGMLSARPATIDALARRSYCSKPTAHRAIAAMRQAGASLRYDRASNTWSLVRPWHRPPYLLTRAELVALVSKELSR
jgi:hypothetical protein